MTSEKEWMERHLSGVTPLPFGERTAPRRRWRRKVMRLRLPEAVVRRGVAGVGLAALASGVALVLWPSQISVSVDGTSYRVGDVQLVEQAPGVYRGDAALVVRRQPDGTVVAASSFVHAGQEGTGVCRVDARAGLERCAFRLAGRPFVSAVDVYGAGGWQRHYSDGVDVGIGARSMWPVPFPVGR